MRPEGPAHDAPIPELKLTMFKGMTPKLKKMHVPKSTQAKPVFGESGRDKKIRREEQTQLSVSASSSDVRTRPAGEMAIDYQGAYVGDSSIDTATTLHRETQVLDGPGASLRYEYNDIS